MIEIYLIELPKNYSVRIMAFKTLKKAKEISEKLQKENPAGSSGSHSFEPFVLPVYEDQDIKAINND